MVGTTLCCAPPRALLCQPPLAAHIQLWGRLENRRTNTQVFWTRTSRAMTEATMDNGRYLTVRELNRGGTAIVYEAVDQLESTRVALKVLHSDETGAPVMPSDAIRREVQYSGRLHHPNICRLLRAFLDEERGLLVMVFELVEGMDLLDVINASVHGHLEEKQARSVFAQLLSGVAYIHQNGLVHRDLKSENVMLEGDTLKIIDFGLARSMHSAKTLRVGTPDYMAPEMLGGGSVLKDAALGDLGYSPAPIDVWSMGVLLYLCVAGQYPFECKDTPENLTLTLRNVLAGKYHPLPKSLNPQVMDLLGRMLTVNPQQRITLEEIQAHPWLQQREARVGLPPAEFHEAAPGSALSPTADKATAFRLSSRSAQQPLAVAAPASCLEGVFRADAKRSSRDAPMEADAGVTASMFYNHAVPGGAPHEWCVDMEEPGEPTPFTGSLGAMFRSLFSF